MPNAGGPAAPRPQAAVASIATNADIAQTTTPRRPRRQAVPRRSSVELTATASLQKISCGPREPYLFPLSRRRVSQGRQWTGLTAAPRPRLASPITQTRHSAARIASSPVDRPAASRVLSQQFAERFPKRTATSGVTDRSRTWPTSPSQLMSGVMTKNPSAALSLISSRLASSDQTSPPSPLGHSQRRPDGGDRIGRHRYAVQARRRAQCARCSHETCRRATRSS